MSGITFGSMFLAYLIGLEGVVSLFSSAMIESVAELSLSPPELAVAPDPAPESAAGVVGLDGSAGLASVFELAGLVVLSLAVVESVFFESVVVEPAVVLVLSAELSFEAELSTVELTGYAVGLASVFFTSSFAGAALVSALLVLVSTDLAAVESSSANFL